MGFSLTNIQEKEKRAKQNEMKLQKKRQKQS